jgi:cell division septation protein DedD
VRKGRYHFDAVRSGDHLVRLLLESLPDGARIAGDAEVPATLGRDALTAEISFVVAVEKRPEIRRVFPPRGGLAAAAPRSTTEPRTNTSAPRISTPPAATFFVVQVAALSDSARAKELVASLKAAGMPAYLLAPPPTNPDGLYRVRLGPYQSSASAQKTAAALSRKRGEKLWVTKQE